MVNNSVQQLDRTFSALGDETRRGILMQLARGSAPVKDLAKPYAMSPPAISKHLRVLEQAGLISREKRGREHWCRMEAKGMADAAAWIEDQRRLWDGLLDSLEAYLARTDSESAKSKGKE